MGCFGVLLGAGTAWWLWHGGNTVAACLAVALTLISFWSFGVMHKLRHRGREASLKLCRRLLRLPGQRSR